VQFALTVPGVKDRVAQAAVRIVIEPLFEASFRPGSYGFRPKRGAKQAIYDIRKWVTYGYDKVIDLDLKSYLDHASYCPLIHEMGSNRFG
jgi:RNA-directed DNA polymerase